MQKAAPLTALLKKDAFTWHQEAHLTFDNLKIAMSSTPVLALPNFDGIFVIETNAFGIRVGATLTQTSRLVAYFSQALPKRSKVKSTYEGELMAIVFIVQKLFVMLEA